MADFQEIRFAIDDHVATITLDRPERLNAITNRMIDELCEAINRTDENDEVRVVIFTGAGDRAFSTGAELRPEGGRKPFARKAEVESLSDVRVRDGGGRLTLRLLQSKKPLIAACNGVAVGLGATMQLAMDMRLASDKARYGFVFARRGIVPEAASSWFLPRIVGLPLALEWCMTGRLFDAQEALDGGLVRSVHGEEELMPAARELAHEISDNNSAISVALLRAMLWRNSAADHPMLAHRVDSRLIYRLSRSGDATEGVASFLEKRSPVFPDKVSSDMPDFWPWWEEPPWT